MRIPAAYSGSTTLELPAARDPTARDELLGAAAPNLLVLDSDHEIREQLERLYVANG